MSRTNQIYLKVTEENKSIAGVT